jgi:DNA topoisomerase VI subunit B
VKNNTQRSKALLQQALSNLPQDGALQSARQYLGKALQEISKVEGKRQKREVIRQDVEKQWKEKMEMFWQPSPDQAQNMLNQIDSMIEMEQKKIEEIQQKNQPTKNKQILND